MATKSFNLPAHVRQVSSDFTYSGGYYTGTAIFAVDDGFLFVAPTITNNNYNEYNIVITRADSSTFNIKSTTYCTFSVYSSNKRLQFTLKAAARIDNSVFNLDWALEATLEAVARTLTINQNLTECSISGLPSVVYDNSVLNLTLTANTGYEFKTTPVLTFNKVVINPQGNPTNTENFTVSNDKLTATLQIDLSQYDLNYIDVCDTLTITATAESNIKTVPITKNLSNCTTNAPTNITGDMTTVNIICTANNNYEFDTAPTIIFYDNNNVALHSFTFNVLASKLSANVTFDVSQFNDFENVESIVLTATAAAVAQIVDVQTNIQNAVLNGLPADVYTDTILNLTVTANNGYEFTTVPNIFFIDGNGNPQFAYFTRSADNLTGTITVNLGDYVLQSGQEITINANATAITPYVEKYGTINVYKVTENNLKDFAQLRFFKEKEGVTDVAGGYFENIDLGKFVHSIKRFYCNIGNTLNAVLKCGNYNTNIQVQTPENDNITLNCGSVTLPYKNNDITDYQTEINLFLPFVGFVSLNSDYLGKTFTLQYVCNLITANTIIKLISDGVTYEFYECNLANDIIYKQSETPLNISTFGNVDFNLQVLKGLTPFVIIKYFETENNNLYNNENKRLQINNIVGFAKLTEITNFVNDFITQTEYNLLMSELENGVFVENLSGS